MQKRFDTNVFLQQELGEGYLNEETEIPLYEDLMEEYGLSEDERLAFRNIDLKRLGELGVHPYFLPQVSRLFHGGAYNHNNSPSAQAYGKSVVEGQGKTR